MASIPGPARSVVIFFATRLFFIAMRGLQAIQAEAWMEMLHDTVMPEIDPSIARLVQINYLARPKWHGHGRHDPLGVLQPCWMVRGRYHRWWCGFDRCNEARPTEADQKARR